ncbi:MAG: hypothetical protein LKM43_00215 [Wolbachia endosymbiont of Penenirmus auritus]|nr:hypothetical protein [Wolbachia endosymbiont of Penenirmus auritus]
MNKSKKEIKHNNLKECLSSLSPDDTNNVEQQVSKDKNIAKLLTSIISDINLIKELLTKHKRAAKKFWKREYDTILQLIDEEASKERFFTKTQFCYFFEDKFGLKGHHSIRKHINVLATEGYIKFREEEVPTLLRVKVMELPVYLTRKH